ncbi:MAG: PP2C family protein-serine/threonine phosphatase [Solirubrobacteraceae bacterium]
MPGVTRALLATLCVLAIVPCAYATASPGAGEPRSFAGTPHGGPESATSTGADAEGASAPRRSHAESSAPTTSGSGLAGSATRASGTSSAASSGSKSPAAGLAGQATGSSRTAAAGAPAAAQTPSTPASTPLASGSLPAGNGTQGAGAGSSASPSSSAGGRASVASGLHGSARNRAGNGRPGGASGTAGRSGAAVSGAVNAAGLAAAGSLAGPPSGSAAQASGAPRRTTPGESSKGLAPAIHTVIERIAGVVPQPIWLMMAILALLSTMLAIRSWLTSNGARRLERQRRRLADEVGTLQAALLPDVPEWLGAVRTSVAYRPAEGPAAGGDFYDLFALADGRVAVVMGDVSGHGPAALPQTALLRYTLRTHLNSGLSPRSALRATADMLDHQLEGSFATAALAVLDPAARTLVYACAGHPPPIVLGSDALELTYAAASPPIGAGLPTGLRETVIALPGAARICFYTDGLIEAWTQGRLFGATRLAQTLASLPPEATAERLLERIVAATDSRPDDMAACVLALAPGPSAPSCGEPATATARAHDGASAALTDTAHCEPFVVSEEIEVGPADLAGGRAERFLAACGLSRVRSHDALDAARIVAGPDGAAVLRAHAVSAADQRDDRRVDVLPNGAHIVQMMGGHGDGLRRRSAPAAPELQGAADR